MWIELGRSPTRHGRVFLASGAGSEAGPRVGFHSDDFNVVQGMVAAGAGVAVVPELALTNVRHDVTVRTLGRSAPMRTIEAATLAGVHRSPATAALLELLTEVSERRLEQTRRGDEPARA